MASRKKSDGIRVFRKHIAALKKKGLISPSIDARKIRPTKHYRKVVKQYSGVIQGKQTTVKVPRSKVTALKELGYNVRLKRAVIDKWPGQKVILDKRDVKGFRVQQPGGIQSIDLPGPKGVHVDTYLNRIQKQADKIKAPGERVQYAFKFYGNNSRRTFHNLEDMRRYLERYGSITRAEDSADRDLLKEQIQNLTVYKIPAKYPWFKRKKLGRRKL